MKKIYLTVLIFLALTTIGFSIVELKEVNLNEATDIALKNNLNLRSLDLDVKISKNKIKEANKLDNPNLNTYWNFGKAGKGNPESIGVSEKVEILKRSSRKNLQKLTIKQQKIIF